MTVSNSYIYITLRELHPQDRSSMPIDQPSDQWVCVCVRACVFDVGYTFLMTMLQSQSSDGVGGYSQDRVWLCGVRISQWKTQVPCMQLRTSVSCQFVDSFTLYVYIALMLFRNIQYLET